MRKFGTIKSAPIICRSGSGNRMYFLYPSAFPASAIINLTVESIIVMTTQQWFADHHYAVIRFDIGEFAQGKCLDMALSNLSSGCTLTMPSSKIIKPSITNQFLNRIPPSSLSYPQSPQFISQADQQSGAPNA